MAWVRVQPAAIRMTIRPMERLLDVLDDHGPVLPLACRAMNCGICRVRTVAEADAWRSPTERELTLLRQLRAAPDERLACQLVLESDITTADVILEVVRDDAV